MQNVCCSTGLENREGFLMVTPRAAEPLTVTFYSTYTHSEKSAWQLKQKQECIAKNLVIQYVLRYRGNDTILQY